MKPKQFRQTDKRVEYICISNAIDTRTKHERDPNPTVRRINVQAAISLAFALGARFGVSHTTLAQDFMEQWLEEYAELPTVTAIRHQQAIESIIFPITHYEHSMEGNNEDDH